MPVSASLTEPVLTLSSDWMWSPHNQTSRLRQPCRTMPIHVPQKIVVPVLGLAGRHVKEIKAGTWQRRPFVISVMEMQPSSLVQSAAKPWDCTPCLKIALDIKPVAWDNCTEDDKPWKIVSQIRSFTSIQMVHTHTHPTAVGYLFCAAERLEVAKGRSLNSGPVKSLSQNVSENLLWRSKAIFRFLRKLHFMCHGIRCRITSQLMGRNSQHIRQFRQLLRIQGGEIFNGSRSHAFTDMCNHQDSWIGFTLENTESSTKAMVKQMKWNLLVSMGHDGVDIGSGSVPGSEWSGWIQWSSWASCSVLSPWSWSFFWNLIDAEEPSPIVGHVHGISPRVAKRRAMVQDPKEVMLQSFDLGITGARQSPQSSVPTGHFHSKCAGTWLCGPSVYDVPQAGEVADFPSWKDDPLGQSELDDQVH